MKTSLSILILFFSITTFSQKGASDYFEQASNFIEEDNYDEALKNYQYIIDNHKNNDLYSRAFYNIGYIHFIQNDFNKAITIFKEILESEFNEKDNLDGGIMADPYTNYRHRASSYLSDIYYTNKKYDTALYYFALSDTTYPYLHFCGNAYASQNIYTALRYADIYKKLKQPDKAIEKLLPSVLILLSDNTKVIEELKILLKEKIELKLELDNSLSNIYSKKNDQGDFSYTSYYFKFLNAEIEVPNRIKYENDKFDKKKAIIVIKETDFYKMIEEI